MEYGRKLHIIYRSYGGENAKGRPDYYSKLLSLTSFVRALQQVNSRIADIIFLNDGPIPQDRLRIMEKAGEVLQKSNLGLRGSMRSALSIPALRNWPHDHLVWFSEDDYLYLPQAFHDLLAAAEVFPGADYFALYAMIGSRLPNGGVSRDRVQRQWAEPPITPVNNHPWRNAVSTTSTFGAKVKPLIEDQLMMQLAIASGGAWDHTTCLMYQGFAPYPLDSLMNSLLDPEATKSWPHRLGIFGARVGLDCYQAARALQPSNRRILVAPDPALITHLETLYLASGTDWRSVAERTQEWMMSEYHVA